MYMVVVIFSWVSNWIKVDGIMGCDFLGCVVVVVVFVSFNVLIVGVFFVFEVVLCYFVVYVFVFIVIVFVVGIVINWFEFGDVIEFMLLMEFMLVFY